MKSPTTIKNVSENCKIAVIGLGCNYPGAKSPLQLWENILARRQQFREMPEMRLPMLDYYDPDPTVANKTYQKKAAVLDGYKFDWLDRKIPKSTFESTDIVHWLALDTALQALADTRIAPGMFSKDTTGVILGNTLTGEFTRSNQMLLRWPYVKKALRSSLKSRGLTHLQSDIEDTMENYYKSVFAPVTEDTLAGGLANTIAGRICNYLDIHGGGYIVDGACSSSLLAICTAANYLEMHQMDMVIAGGVDISLDTFELIGFAKTGALTKDEMRVYDKDGKGFIPGEGCGIVVLKRLDDAIRDNNPVYAVLEGWGISSDGKGGITAPSAAGQAMALRRAYDKAKFDTINLNFIEGHGTGTTVGDKTELEGITLALNKNETLPQRNCGVTSFKSIVGHTKAAAGVGAFIKTTMALNRRVIPPTAGLKEYNPIFEDRAKTIYPVILGQIFEPNTLMYAGVSAMGFGGINSHILLRSGDLPFKKLQPVVDERKLLVSNQSHELYLFTASDKPKLITKINEVIIRVKGISCAEMADFANDNNSKINYNDSFRAAIVVAEPFDFERKLSDLVKTIANSSDDTFIGAENNTIVTGKKNDNLKIGALFPGQGAQRINMSYKLVERFDWAKDIVKKADAIFKTAGTDNVLESMFRRTDSVKDVQEDGMWKDTLKQTNISQPAITLASLLWNTYLEKLGIKISIATGHSLGELMAFYASGFISQETLLLFAAFRGKIMSECGKGTMASLVCSVEQAEKFIKMAPGYVDVANINSPEQTVISGDAESINFIVKLAEAEHIAAVKLPVSAAFHSKLISGAAQSIADFAPLANNLKHSDDVILISSVTGSKVDAKVNLNSYFSDQSIQRVNFINAINTIKKDCDVLVEIGPGRVLSGLSENIQKDIKGFSVETRVNDDLSLNTMLANLFVMGANIKVEELYNDRLVRDFVPASQKEFIVNPLERPFPDIEDIRIQNSGINSDILVNHLNIPIDKLNQYLSVRGNFVQEMILTDMKYANLGSNNLQPSLNISNGQTTSSITSKTITAAPIGDLKSLIFQKIESVTGFPSDKFQENMKLLDDFNLDSIKAGSLLNDLFKTLKIQGKINPANFLNASLLVIKNEIEKFAVIPVSSPQQQGSTKEDIENTVFEMLAAKTGFPKEGLKPEMRLLNDLNLDSIKAGSILAQLIKKYNLQGKVEAAAHANASIAEIIEKVKEFAPIDSGITSSSITKTDINNFVFSLIEEKTGFPQRNLKPEFKLLDDLNLDSIKANAFIAAVSKKYGLLGKFEPARFVNSSLTTIIDEIDVLLNTNATEVDNTAVTQIAEPVYSYSVELIPEALVIDQKKITNYWANKKVGLIYTNSNINIALSIQQLDNKDVTFELIDVKDLSTRGANFSFLFVLMPINDSPEKYEETINLLSAVSQIQNETLSAVGFIQYGDGFFGRNNSTRDLKKSSFSVSAFVGSLHLERPNITYRVIEVDPVIKTDAILSVLFSEFISNDKYVTVGFDKILQRRKMVYELTTNKKETRKVNLTENDVIVVTGGAKGITAECALTLARKYHCKMALVGSSNFKGEAGDIKDTLDKYFALNITAKYYACNITDELAVKNLIKTINNDLGAITGIIHGAGRNVPRRAENVSFSQALDEIAPKVYGAFNIINAINKKDLKYFFAFTSIIGVTGMTGNSWYAFSNETLDLLLRDLNKNHQVDTVSLAYSIWGEVGMGERMGSATALGKMGIGSISTEKGVNEFMQWVENKTDDQQIVIAASLGGLDTWKRKPYAKPVANRYLDKIVNYEPGISLKIRNVLAQETDTYLDDHNFNGSLLFPTVFGLEAMTQAASMVTGIVNFSSLRLEKISLLKPIVVPQNGETEIEVHATVLDSDPAFPDVTKVYVGISTEHSGFTDDHFSTIVVFGSKMKKDTSNVKFDINSPLPIIPFADLYSWLLFQGARFQQIEKVYEVGAGKTIFATKKLVDDTSSRCFSTEIVKPFILGSPLLRDTLLQSVQLILTENIMLPIGIESWEIFEPENQYNGGVVECVLTDWNGDIGTCDVTFENEKKQITERIKGYAVKSLEKTPRHPVPVELNDLSAYINENIQKEFSKYEDVFEELPLVFAHKDMFDFNTLTQSDRHILEQKVLNTFVENNKQIASLQKQLTLSWDANGKPFVNEADDSIKISVSHSKSLLINSLGSCQQGCDIEAVDTKEKDEWIDILFPESEKLVLKIKEIDSNHNLSFTRLWGVQEACIKAFGAAPKSVSLNSVIDKNVLFDVNTGDSIYQVLTIPVKLFPKSSFVLSVLVKEKATPKVEMTLPMVNTNSLENVFDPENGKFATQFYTAFKDCRGFHGKTYFINFPLWMGSLREYILTPVKKNLLKDLGSGEFGMVTNNSTIRIYNEAETLEKITGRIWITDKSDLKNSFIDLAYEWLKHTDDGKTIKIASGELSTTWVKIEDRGVVKLSPIPDYFYEFLNRHIRLSGNNEPSYFIENFPEKKDLGELIYKSVSVIRPEILLNKKVYHTGIFNGNTVGNLYFSNYYDWQAKNIESFIFDIAPEIYLQIGKAGEYICLETNVNHLQEAMPFEDIEVHMFIEELYSNGCKMFFEYYSLGHGEKRKLAYGNNLILWAKRDFDYSLPSAISVPEKLLKMLSENIGISALKLN